MEDGRPKLGGTLINRIRSNPNELTETNLEGRTVIQRDTEKEFNVIRVHEKPLGFTRERVATLKSGDGAVATFNVDDLILKLKTPGSPWRLKG